MTHVLQKEKTLMPSTNECDARADMIVVGGGLAGLMTAALVARAGRKVVVLERSGHPGGRAMTQVDRGIHFNLGPHALYCRGQAFRLLKEMGVAFTGAAPDVRRAVLRDGDRSYTLPSGLGSALLSRMLTMQEKVRFLSLFTTLPKLDARGFDRVTLQDWIRGTAGDGNLARLLQTLCRLSTYADDPNRLSAGAAIDQLKYVLDGGVWYLDGGWQTLVDGLRDRLLHDGGELRTSARAKSVRSDSGHVTVELASGEELHGRTAVLAIDPSGAVELLRLPAHASLARWAEGCTPVLAACFDVALDGLPRPRCRVAFGLDRPLYFSVHSASARLAPRGIAVIHLMKYLGGMGNPNAEHIEGELEAFLEGLQPGWRGRVVARRFLPGMTVAQSLPRAEEGGLAVRPGAEVEGVSDVFLAGDWVGPEGMLADASAASAREAARRVLDSFKTRRMHPSGSVSHATA
jgi:phytoene dehydrogenase-like protein